MRHTDLQLHNNPDAGGEGGGDASAAAAKQSSSVVSFIGGGSGEWARLQASSRNNKGVNEGVNEGARDGGGAHSVGLCTTAGGILDTRMSTHFGQMLGLVLRSTACTSEVCGNQPRMCPIGTPGLATSRPENEEAATGRRLAFALMRPRNRRSSIGLHRMALLAQ